jgi:uncharacterized protein (DUF1015 family)
MAEVLPLRALHYDLDAVPSLDAVTAPPYDVIDNAQRRELLERSPHNVVAIDLPQAPSGQDPYEVAARRLDEWKAQAILSADEEPAIWALTQDYEAPDGARMTRHGLLARVRVTDYGPGTIRPHERTQPGPKEDRLRLTRATRHNLSPIFSLYDGDAWPEVEGHLGEPWGEATDADGTVNRVWRVVEPAAIEAVTAALAPAELLIADGHHRYETARAYATEVGGEGDHRYTLMCLTSLEDPGLTVFPTHRLLSDLDDPARQEALGAGLKERFHVEEVALEDIEPSEADGPGAFGYIDSHFRRAFRLRLKDPAVLDGALAGRSEAYRRLDAAILEKLVLDGILGMSEKDVEAKRGIGYAKSVADVLAALDGGYQAAFVLRPTPVDQVRQVAAAGETMPPKSTYFFPKLLSGLVFNPL